MYVLRYILFFETVLGAQTLEMSNSRVATTPYIGESFNPPWLKLCSQPKSSF